MHTVKIRWSELSKALILQTNATSTGLKSTFCFSDQAGPVNMQVFMQLTEKMTFNLHHTFSAEREQKREKWFNAKLEQCSHPK